MAEALREVIAAPLLKERVDERGQHGTLDEEEEQTQAQQHEQDRQYQVMTAFVEEAECREEQPRQRASVGARAVVSRDETRRRAAFPREGW